MASDIVLNALSSLDGMEFTESPRCPSCGGFVLGHDMRVKRFAVIREGDAERIVHVRVKRFTCRDCRKLCNAPEPFYPDTRIGSPVIDLCITLSRTMPFSRTSRVLEAMGVIVDRSSCRHFGSLALPETRTADVFGFRLPFSILSLSSLAARSRTTDRLTSVEILAACGNPGSHRATGPMPGDNGDGA
jgi:hypothetical protein